MSDTPRGWSPLDRVVSLKALAANIEARAADYWAEVEALRAPLQAVLDARDDPARWRESVVSAVDAIREVGLTEVVTDTSYNERWRRKSEANFLAEAVAGFAFWSLLAEVAEGNPGDDQPFRRYAESFAAHPEAEAAAPRQTHDILGFVLHEHFHRVAGRYTAVLIASQEVCPGQGFALPWRLERAGATLSGTATEAVEHWDDLLSTGRYANFGAAQILQQRRPQTAEPTPTAPPSPGIEEVKPVGTGSADVEPSDVESDPCLKLIALYTNGSTDRRLVEAAEVVRSKTLTVHDKLVRLDGLIPIPPTASGETLGKLLGVSGTAVKNTDWWDLNRKGRNRQVVGEREARLRERGKLAE